MGKGATTIRGRKFLRVKGKTSMGGGEKGGSFLIIKTKKGRNEKVFSSENRALLQLKEKTRNHNIKSEKVHGRGRSPPPRSS